MLVHPFVPAYLLLEQKKDEQKLILLWLQHSKLHIYCIQNSPSAVIQSPGSPYANSSISTSSAICFQHLTMRLVLCQICHWTLPSTPRGRDGVLGLRATLLIPLRFRAGLLHQIAVTVTNVRMRATASWNT